MSNEAKGVAAFPPVTYFYGEDSFLMEKVVAECIEALVEEESRPFDLEILFGDEVGAEEVAASANRLPFMSGKRVVILKRMEKWNATRIQTLLKIYIADPSPDTCLILCYGGKPDRRTKTMKSLESGAGQSRSFTPTGDRQLATWVDQYFRQRGLELAPGAAEMVVEYLGPDLHRLRTELLKIELFHADRDGPITVNRLGELLKKVTTRPIFDLAPLFGRGEKKEAVRLLGQLMDSGEEAIPLLGLLAGRYRQMILARAVTEQGGGTREVMDRLDIRMQWLARKLAPQLIADLKSTGDRGLASGISHLAWADAHLKRTDRTLTSAVMVALASRLFG